MVAGAFFALASTKPRKSAKKKEHKSESAERESAPFPPSHTESPVPDPKTTWRGEMKSLEEDGQIVS